MQDKEYHAMFAVEKTHWWFVSRRLFVQKILGIVGIHPGRKLRIIDIGAGTGGMVEFLAQYGRVSGIEPSSVGRRLAKKHAVVLKNGTAQKTGLPNKSQDLVCFFDVLYHRQINEQKALREAWRVLKQGGLLVVTDAAMPWLYSHNDVAVQGARRYTKSSLKKTISQAGFMPMYATYTFFVLFPVFALWRLWQRFFSSKTLVGSDVHPLPGILNTTMKLICTVEAQLLPYISYPWGSSVVVVARKR